MEQPEKCFVLVTGAARGIGRATAELLDRSGYHVLAADLAAADFRDLRENSSSRLETIELDITRVEEIEAVAGRISQLVGEEGLHGLINNAGIAINGPVEFVPLEEFRRIFEVNFFGHIAVIQAMMPLLRRATGRVINVTSGAVNLIAPYEGPYSSSKCALEAITEALHHEVAKWGIRVISVQPGWVDTRLFDSAVKDTDRIMEAMPESAHRWYGEVMDNRRGRIEDAREMSIGPEKVADVVLRALRARSPARRYLVGSAAKLWAVLGRLPVRARGVLFAKFAE